MQCPSCSKRLPYTVRYCAYCGTQVRAFVPPSFSGWPAGAWSWPRVLEALRTFGTGAAGVLAGTVGGGLAGLVLGGLGPGLVLGALGMGASAAVGDRLAPALTDRPSSLRFGLRMGLLGGALPLAGGWLMGLWVSYLALQPAGLAGLGAWLAGGLLAGLASSLDGVAAGLAVGLIVGWFAAPRGQALMGRLGSVLGGAAAWTLATVFGGVFAGDMAGIVTGASRPDAIVLGLTVHVLGGAALVAWQRRRLRGWFK
jgi:hypothetical protein